MVKKESQTVPVTLESNVTMTFNEIQLTLTAIGYAWRNGNVTDPRLGADLIKLQSKLSSVAGELQKEVRNEGGDTGEGGKERNGKSRQRP